MHAGALQLSARVRIDLAAEGDFFKNWRGPNHSSFTYRQNLNPLGLRIPRIIPLVSRVRQTWDGGDSGAVCLFQGCAPNVRFLASQEREAFARRAHIPRSPKRGRLGMTRANCTTTQRCRWKLSAVPASTDLSSNASVTHTIPQFRTHKA
jgi:hypothetical protein